MKRKHSRSLVILGVLLVVLIGIALVSDYAQEEDTFVNIRKEPISVINEVPRVGPYSEIISAGCFVFSSAQVALDPDTGRLIEGDITAQTKQIFRNFTAQLADVGLSLGDVVSITVCLTDMSLFAEMNTAYSAFFSKPYPVRSCVEVSALPVEGALLTVQLIAVAAQAVAADAAER